MQAQSRLATLLMDCRLYEAAVPVLEDLAQLLPPSDTGRQEVFQRLTSARTCARRKQAPDHYKLLGLNHACEPDEASLPQLL